MGKHRLAEAVLTSIHNQCFEQKYEKYQSFLSENFQFLEVKFSIYLNRCVCVMHTWNSVSSFCTFWSFTVHSTVNTIKVIRVSYRKINASRSNWDQEKAARLYTVPYKSFTLSVQKKDVGKQWRSCSDTAFCGVWTGSTLLNWIQEFLQKWL